MSKYNLQMELNGSIGEFIRKQESDYVGGSIQFSKYVSFSPYEDISTILAYLDSKHISGPTDSQNREKPFFNIVLASRNIWYRATDIDRKNIKLRSTKLKNDLGTFFATVYLQDWMRKSNFGTFLNAWGLNSSGFNESVIKFVEQDGTMVCQVIPWSQIICDFIDFKNNPKIQILEYTEAQLYKQGQMRGYDMDMVKQLCEDAATARKTADGQQKDNKADYFKLYEVHGEFPKSYLTEKESDQDEYSQQMHVVSFLATDKEGEFNDYTLFKGKESKDPYMCPALLPEVDGSVGLRGSVKTLFDAQWMQNHSVKAMKDQLDLASKMVFQTADKQFVGQNVLTAIENGDILVHEVNAPITLVNNDKSPNLGGLENYRSMWKQIGMEITGISESMLGINPPSGQAWRQTNDLLAENHSLFELMTENRGLAIEEMLRNYILPHIKKKLDHKEEIAATLEMYGIDQIDARYIKNSAIRKSNKAVQELLLEGHPVTKETQKQITDTYAGQAQQNLQEMGTQRYFKPSELDDSTWRELFKDLEWEPEVDVTNENLDKEAMQTINTLLTLMADPVKAEFFETARGKMLFNKALELTGAVSTIELNSIPPAPKRGPAAPKISESINYKDAPEDIKRQMEQKAGLQPSQINNTPAQAASPAQPAAPAGAM